VSDELVLDLFAAAWWPQARCRAMDTSLFFPPRGASLETDVAKRICAGCDVRQQCLDYALGARETIGIWGGLSENQRRRLRAHAG
jgi:WhiB family redox-sensing transcriptional regulator